MKSPRQVAAARRRSSEASTLARGLLLLEHITRADGPVRFSALRAILPGVGDPTLTRLLQRLEASGHIQRVEPTGYTPGPATERWLGALAKATCDPRRLIDQAVDDVSRSTNESAGAAVLEGDRLAVVASRTVPGAVSIIGPGQTLHFEPDHAAALVVLEDLPPARRRSLLCGPNSAITGERAFRGALRSLQMVDGIKVDRSRARVGICRMATGFSAGTMCGALFLCLTVERAEQAAHVLASALSAARDRLREGLHGAIGLVS